MTAERLDELLRAAMGRRTALVGRLAAGQTDCYRLLHGSQEGAPGITLDRYGDLVLLQAFRAPLGDRAVAAVRGVIDELLPGADLVYNDRSRPGSRVTNVLGGADLRAAESDRVVQEHGVRFHLKARHRGQDPWLFLDLRTTRRAVMADATEKSVLNLFAYTCGVGVAAAVAGARRVLNIDFARSSLAVGTANTRLNAVSHRCTELTSDVFPALRQLAGVHQPTMVRGRRLPEFPSLDRESFDLVVLDPPTLAKSPFGVVDLLRDYQSVLKPALATVVDGGLMYCTCHLARVDEKEWHGQLRRCAEKHGRPIRSLDVIRPGEDFPSPDGRPPLKVARLGF